VVADLFKDQKPGAYASEEEWKAYDAKVLAYSKIVAGAVSAYSGGDAQTAITTAETAVSNNFLTFDENQLRKQAAQACQAGNAQACADAKRWNEIDGNRDEKVRQVCAAAPGSQNCRDWRDFALLARASYSGQAESFAAGRLTYGDPADVEELQSIQKLLAGTPHTPIVQAPNPQLQALLGIIADLTPLVGDAKAFYEAENPFDYALAMIGALGPVGDGAAAAIRAAKVAHRAGNAAEAEKLLKDAHQSTKNYVNGWAFEGSGLQALGLDKNKARITQTTRSGATITIVPDGINGTTLVEFKNVINITDSSQFRGYAATGQPIVLIVSPRTQTISGTVTDWIYRRAPVGSTIRIFDPVEKTFTDWPQS
jgi:hypothetical protein